MPPPITSTLAATGEAEAAGEEEAAAMAASAHESMTAKWERRVRSVSRTEDGTVESAGGMSTEAAAAAEAMHSGRRRFTVVEAHLTS